MNPKPISKTPRNSEIDKSLNEIWKSEIKNIEISAVTSPAIQRAGNI